MAYQGSETDATWVRDMNLNCPEILRPDVCIFLDLTPEESMERISRRHGTQEIYETVEKLTAVRARFYRVFEELKDTDRICVVNAARYIDQIHKEIVGLLELN
jgi:dTMP kinase